MKADEIKVGGYQVLTVLLLSINFITVAMSHALSLFYKFTPKFYCQEGSKDVGDVSNRTYGCRPAGCPGGYLFEPSSPSQLHYEHSVVTDWQLVCERAHLLRSLGELYFAGLLLGGLLTGFVADRLGRLPVLAVCLYAQGVMAVALNIVEKYQLFLIFRGLQGFFMQGLESCTFILCMELFPAKYRTLVALVILSIRSLGLVLISGFSYFIPNWRILQLISCIPTAVTVLYIWLIPESPRWLIAKGKTIDAELLIERISKYNSLLGLSDRSGGGGGSNAHGRKPEKPKRKTRRVTSDDAKCADLERSLHESLNLLSADQPDSPPPLNDRGESVKNEKNQKLSDLDMEEISNASLMVVADEKSRSEAANNAKVENNGANTPGYLLVSKEALNDRQGSTARAGFMGFLKRRFIGRTCVLLMFAWFASSIAFHSLVSMPQKLSSNRQLSLSLAALMEIGTFVFSYLLATSRCGRRWGLSLGQIFAGAVCIVIAIIVINENPRSPIRWLAYSKVAAIVIGRIVNIMSFFILRLVMIELLPTTSRATGVGLCIGAEMIGGLLMPLFLMINRFVPELGRIAIGLTCICSGLLVLSLPETLQTVLPDSAEESRRNVLRANNPDYVDEEDDNDEQTTESRSKDPSESCVEAGNGIIVSFKKNQNTDC